jgi:hypothetical protein
MVVRRHFSALRFDPNPSVTIVLLSIRRMGSIGAEQATALSRRKPTSCTTTVPSLVPRPWSLLDASPVAIDRAHSDSAN